jgi:lipoyl(octanoyl) transferase
MWGGRVPELARERADVTVRPSPDKARSDRTGKSGRVGRAREQAFDFNRNAVAADDDGSSRHRHVVGKNSDLILLGGIEFDDGTAAEAEHLVDGHRGFAQHDCYVDRDIVQCRQGVPARFCRCEIPTVLFHHGHGYEVVNTRNDLKFGLLPVAGSPPVEWLVSDGLVDYDTALAAMTARATAIARGEARELVWLIEHPPLYTSGTSGRPHELIDARFPVYTAGRGGQFTYHGPGQRVGYVMLDLKRRAPDVRRFVATIEEWIMRTLAAFAVRGERRNDRIGVWVRRPDRRVDAEDKIAAIGIRVQGWVTLHGFSLNVAPDLTHFSGIVPCGVSDQRYGVTSLADLGREVSMRDADRVLRAEFEPLFGATADAQRVASTENRSPGRRSAKSAESASR